MDKGAHFYRCDFQVHTPRDRQWQGDRPVSDVERREYAVDFIAACRRKGLHAVAITDHHDMAFIPYMRDAAANELGVDNQPLPEAQRIHVFPGMELTLGVPCQALLIFGADFPNDMFALAATRLSIAPEDSSEPQCREITRLTGITTLQELCDELDKHEFLKGTYIVLPNVSEGGQSTLLRSGFPGHYKNMLCIGGYLDGMVEQLGEGNTRILSGQDPAYGRKALALFQTSDSRSHDFAHLGVATTWVKWAVPTAEALRQACLARESRISQHIPQIPTVSITSLSVSNSSFLGPINIEFNTQFNAIIGGRGTGKSTILEYLRWGLCDEASSSVDYDDLPTYEIKRDSLIRQTLTAHNANVQVNFIVNGVPHSVRRDSATEEITLKIAEGNYEPCRESDVRNLLPIQAFSQKQLSNVAVRLDELTRFIHTPIRQQLDDLARSFEQTAFQLRSVYSKLQQKRSLQRTVANDEREFRSLTEQVTAIRTGLTGITEDEQKLLSLYDDYFREQNIVSAWTERISEVTDADLLALPNSTLMQSLQKQIGLLFDSVKVDIDRITANLRSSTLQEDHPIYSALQQVATLNESYQQAYQAALQKSTAQQAIIDRLRDLDARLTTVRTRLAANRSALAEAGTPEEQFSALREQWCAHHDTRSQLIRTQCSTMTDFSEGQLRATLDIGADMDIVTQRLRSAVSGSGVRSSKLETLCQNISADGDPIRQFKTVLDELEPLALYDPEDSEARPQIPTPNLTAPGLTSADLNRISTKLTPDSWLNLCLTSIGDRPRFEYRTRENEYIRFAVASAGQQATALLTVLLNQGGHPLIIDQPEDDLDNKVIPRIAEQIWKTKKVRQLLFTSHNANLVVNGDAELVVCCDYRVAGEQSSGEVKYEGAIDILAIRKEITEVMEGGSKAFELRRQKYGF